MRGASVAGALFLCFLATHSWGQVAPQSDGEVLVAKLPPGYKVEPQTSAETTITKVMLPEQESQERWTEMVALLVYLGMKSRTPAQMETAMQQTSARTCKESTVIADSSGIEAGYAFALWMMSCPVNAQSGKPQFVISKAIQGRDNFYLVAKEFQFLPSEDQKQRWKQYVSSITVCDSRISGSACAANEAGIRPSAGAIANLIPLTAEKIRGLRSTTNNPSGDYFLGAPEWQKRIVNAFVADNSKADSIALYIAANTAIRIGDVKDAGFLFYAAQIRKHFDSKRYRLPVGEKDLQIYADFLNHTTGEMVNPAVVRDGKMFSAIVDMIEQWNVVPSEDATYPSSVYGTYAIPKEKWSALGEEEKQDFMNNFGNKYKTFLSDPQNVEANNFVQDYNLYKVPHTPENDQKYKKYMEIVKKGLQLQP